ncbi:unnamed protein product, partial [Polarella glacialis]
VLSIPDLAALLVACAGIQDARQLASCSRRLEPPLLAAGRRAIREQLGSSVFCILGGVGPPALASVEVLFRDAGSWETLQPLPNSRHGYAAVVLEAQLYILGGMGGWPIMRHAARLDLASHVWEDLPDMAEPRTSFAAAALLGCIYISGGDGGKSGSGQCKASPTAARFRPNEASVAMVATAGDCAPPARQVGAWEVLPAMSLGRTSVSAATLRGSLYVCGGLGKGGLELRCGERFDPAKNRWIALPNMSAGRACHAVVATRGRIFACGGRTHGRATSILESLAPGAPRWETLPPMRTRRCRPAAAVLAGEIWICGGDDGSRSVGSAERFDPSTKRWEPLPHLLVARSRAAAVALPEVVVRKLRAKVPL